MPSLSQFVFREAHGKEMALIPAAIRSLWVPNPVRPSERS